ncbi:MAG: VacJ family lipoprotein [Methylovulum sp.]|nr:VacJ family lipoprotein [Methylovulum sp.]
MRLQNNPTPPLLSSLAIAMTLVGCATPPAHQDDPWYSWNHGTQTFNDTVDKFIVKPLGQGYEYITPEPVNRGISNLFSNINDIGVTVNDMLQFKLLQGGMDASRFLLNTTVGVVGLFDVATPFDLPKHDEDFGQTLGYWGVGSGPYLVLPFFGPSSPRDTVGRIGDALLNPLTYVSFMGTTASAATAGSKVVDIADNRADMMRTEKIVDEASIDDRYDFIKNSYQQHREYLINDGNSPVDEIELEDDMSDGSDNSPSTSDSTSNTSGGHVLNLSAPEEEK